ncbi:MAG: hypothetical protein JW924_12640 [Fusobacteriaceae bacterium]|nr:hypothetical protein [Fusobacteriaceae bacterium]
MKKILIFIIILFNLQAKSILNPIAYKGISDIVTTQSTYLNEHINKIILSKVYIYPDYESTDLSEEKEFLEKIVQEISKNPKVVIIGKDDVLTKKYKSSYTLKLNFENLKFNYNFGLKHEIYGSSELELFTNESDSYSFTNYAPINLIWKINDVFVIIMLFGIVVLGFITHKLLNKKYPLHIGITTITIIFLFSIYFYVIL